MAKGTRGDFLGLAISSAAIPLCVGASTRGGIRHDFLSQLPPDPGEYSENCNYPDECEAFQSFMLAVTTCAWTGEWDSAARGYCFDPIVVDFRSATEEQAEKSSASEWKMAFDLLTGNTSTVASRLRVNEQNSRIERHLSVFIIGTSQLDFWQDVTMWLNDDATDADGNHISTADWTLTDKIAALASRADRSEVILFSRWTPVRLRDDLAKNGFELYHFPLDVIPREDLEMNRYYHVWRGKVSQSREFRAALWTPRWKRQA